MRNPSGFSIIRLGCLLLLIYLICALSSLIWARNRGLMCSYLEPPSKGGNSEDAFALICNPYSSSVSSSPPSSSNNSDETLAMILPRGAKLKATDVMQSNCSAYESMLESNAHQKRKCSCLHAPAHPGCCRRSWVSVHKHGWHLKDQYQQRHLSAKAYKVSQGEILDTKPQFKNELMKWPIDKDYRLVLSTRNWYDALISGYLYHKSGRECWLDPNGKPLPKTGRQGWDLLWSEYWEKDIKHLKMIRPWQERMKDQSFCDYLANATEFSGMLVHTHFAMIHHYLPLLRFYRARRDDCRRTKFVCYNDLLIPSHDDQSSLLSYSRTAREIVEHIYPMGEGKENNFTAPTKSVTSSHNGHGTSHERELRHRLHEILQQIDAEIWNGTIALGNQLFGCSGEI